MNRNTIEAEILDHANYHAGNAADLGWDVHEGYYFQPDAEILAMEANEMVVAIAKQQEERIVSARLRQFFDEVLFDFRRDGNVAGVGRKVLAYAKYIGHDAVDDWSLGELAQNGNETKAAVSARIRKMCNEPIEAMDGIAQARFQQSPEQRAVSAKAQKGNKNRAGK